MCHMSKFMAISIVSAGAPQYSAESSALFQYDREDTEELDHKLIDSRQPGQKPAL